MKKGALLLTISLYIFVSALTFSFFVQNAVGGEPVLSKGQTVYVPIYSHIIVGEGKRKIQFDLSINLSIRNTDLKNPITILKVEYYDSHGGHVKSFITEPLIVKPMASKYFLISQSDTSGGWGANYIIKWESEKEINEPIIESVTFGVRGSHSISFVSRGKVIKE